MDGVRQGGDWAGTPRRVRNKCAQQVGDKDCIGELLDVLVLLSVSYTFAQIQAVRKEQAKHARQTNVCITCMGIRIMSVSCWVCWFCLVFPILLVASMTLAKSMTNTSCSSADGLHARG